MAKSSLCPSEALQLRSHPRLGSEWQQFWGGRNCPATQAVQQGTQASGGCVSSPSLQAGKARLGAQPVERAPWRALGTQGDGCLPPEVLTCDLERLSSPVRVLGDGVFSTLAHTDCVTLDLWASSHSVPPVQAVGGDEATGRFFPAPSAPRERAPGR